MSLQKFSRQSPVAHDEAIDPDYDEVVDVEYNQEADPDYDEAGQGEFADDFTDSESSETPSQEWYARKQK
jgi:hypothetical protein